MKFTDISDNENSEILNDPLQGQLRGHRPENYSGSLFQVALIEPEIPQNTGNIGRTCVGTRAQLHLVGKLGFEITDRNLKRAGLDYWQHLWWQHHSTFAEWENQLKDPRRVFYFSTKGDRYYDEVEYQVGDCMVFGKETKGLPEDVLRRNPGQVLKIPLLGPIRSLNVATAATVVLYEAIRQLKSRNELDFELKKISI